MSTRATSDRRTAVQGGLLMFAGIIMIVGGIYHAFLGLAAIFRDQVYVSAPNYTYTFDLTGWGWAHLLLGILVAAAGVAVVQGATWGRVVGVALAVLSMLANFLFLPYYPVWSILIIALDVAVIWALITAAPREV
jgi:hypothetical protein